MPTMASMYLQFEVELTMRFELMTSPLPRECSTPEPREQLQKSYFKVEKWSVRQESNLRHQPWKGCTLPTELRTPNLVARDGFEPSKVCTDRFTVCCLWPLGNLAPL